MRPITDINDPRLVKALAHPLRIRILSILEEDAASPSELADQLDAPLGNVAYHVRALANLGLIKLVRTTPVRGAVEHHYKAQGRTRVSDGAWGQVPGIVREAMVDSTIAQIGEYVGAAASAGGFDGDGSHLTRTGLVLDEKGWKEMSAALRKFLEKAESDRDGQQEAPGGWRRGGREARRPRRDAVRGTAGGRRPDGVPRRHPRADREAQARAGAREVARHAEARAARKARHNVAPRRAGAPTRPLEVFKDELGGIRPIAEPVLARWHPRAKT